MSQPDIFDTATTMTNERYEGGCRQFPGRAYYDGIIAGIHGAERFNQFLNSEHNAVYAEDARVGRGMREKTEPANAHSALS